MEKEKVVLLLSGGLDSAVLLHRLIEDYDVFPIIIDYGQRHSVEIYQAQKLISNLKGKVHEGLIFNCNVDMFRGPIEGSNMSAVHPHRNLFFLTIAAMYAKKVGAVTIYHGATKTDQVNFPDCRNGFFRETEEALRQSLGEPIKIETPYIEATKAEIVREGVDKKVPFELTATCYKMQLVGNMIVPCKECAACKARETAFAEVGIDDPAMQK